MISTPLWWLLAVVGLLLIAWLAGGWRGRALRTAPWWRGTVVLLLAGVVATQPSLGRDSHPSGAPMGLDVLLILDRTTSMGAEDYDDGQPRMTGVGKDVEQLVTRLGAARYAVIVSDNEATQALPWTTDASAVTSLAHTTGWRNESYGNGSDIAAAQPLAAQLLDASRTAHPDAHRFVVYLGDGEQTSPRPPTSFAPLAPTIDGALVLGYGTAEGGKMRQTSSSQEYVTRGGVPQLSHIDEDNLRQIAEQLGGTYAHRAAPGAPLPGLPTAAAAAVSDDATPATSLAWLAAAAALVVLLWGLHDAVRSWRRARLEVSR